MKYLSSSNDSNGDARRDLYQETGLCCRFSVISAVWGKSSSSDVNQSFHTPSCTHHHQNDYKHRCATTTTTTTTVSIMVYPLLNWMLWALWTLQLIKASVFSVAAYGFGGWTPPMAGAAGYETPTDMGCAAASSITSLTNWLMSLCWPVWLEAHVSELFIRVIEAWPHSYDVKSWYFLHDMPSKL